MIDNQTYYFTIGKGKWEGIFSFELTNKSEYKKDTIGIKNRFLVRLMQVFQNVFGKSNISSEIQIYPGKEKAGTATNIVRIHKLGLTLYLLNEEYILHPDGTNVEVRAKDRFGPIPNFFTESKVYSAKVHKNGISSIYFMPLLGTKWTCEYFVQEDFKNVVGKLTCKWAQSTEIIHKID